MKVSWPLSTREVILHYYLFEYFQDDLIVVLTNSVPESKSVNGTLNRYNEEANPEAKDVVRVDMVGGFALQKVTSERSYFRTIANMDIKLDIIAPSFINFISRQLIGNGFRLYQKAVASIMSHDIEEFSKTLGDPLYARIREALYSSSGSKGMDGEELKQVSRVLPTEDLIQSNQYGAKDVSLEYENNQCANNVTSMATNAMVLGNGKAFGEIVEADSEEIVQSEKNDEKLNDIPNEEVDASVLKGKRSVYISSEVEHALDTLDKAISMVREYRFHSCMAASSFPNVEPPCREKSSRVDSYPAKLHPSSKDEVIVEVLNRDVLEGTSQGAPVTNSDIQNYRYRGTDSNLEVNPNKVVPTLPEKNLSSPIEASQDATYPLENGAILDQITCSNKQLNTDSVQDMSSNDPNKSGKQKKINTIVTQGMSSDVPKKLSRQKKYLNCCFLN